MDHIQELTAIINQVVDEAGPMTAALLMAEAMREAYGEDVTITASADGKFTICRGKDD